MMRSGSGQFLRELILLFLVVFAGLVVVNSLGFVSAMISQTRAVISRGSLVCAIYALIRRDYRLNPMTLSGFSLGHGKVMKLLRL